MNLGARIRSWRERKAWNQAQLADAAGLSRAAICQYEGGKGTPSQNALAMIVDALGLTMEQFYGAIPTTPTKKTKAAKRAVA